MPAGDVRVADRVRDGPLDFVQSLPDRRQF
jgi:hypothetical protein